MKIRIAGASGQLGHPVAESSKAKSGEIVSLVRTPADTANLGVSKRAAKNIQFAILFRSLRAIR
jgi:putative NADH-flavin reductase